MTELSLDQLSYLAAKARLPEKLVLDTAKETAGRFLETWQGGQIVQKIIPIVVDPRFGAGLLLGVSLISLFSCIT